MVYNKIEHAESCLCVRTCDNSKTNIKKKCNLTKIQLVWTSLGPVSKKVSK